MNSDLIPIRLKPGRERSVLARHSWIFSGAVENIQDIIDGCVHPVFSSQSAFLGIAYFNSRCSIVGRIISYRKEPPEQAIIRSLEQSIALRAKVMPQNAREMYRLVHAEADFLPGLVIDLYGDVAVLQIATLGMDRFKETIVDTLREKLPLTWIYERSTSSSRKMEAMQPAEKTLWGVERAEVLAEENAICYSVDVKKGQKTGFFLDQREMRSLVRSHANGRRLLNCFAYSGGFSLAALLGGVSSCCSVDVSQSALDLLQKNLVLNGLDGDSRHSSLCEDVFAYLRNQVTLPFDMVILDPPAFSKRPHDVAKALTGYREINSQVMKKMLPGSLLLTCSCSHYVTQELFLAMLKESSLIAERSIRILTGHHNSFDHPTSLVHPETEYLKSYLLYIQ